MSQFAFYHTPNAIRNRTQTLTIRLDKKDLHPPAPLWPEFDGPGSKFQAIAKQRGIPRQDAEILAHCRVTAITRRPLNSVTPDEVEREGFHGHTVAYFIKECCRKYKCQPTTAFWFIEFEYYDPTTHQFSAVYLESWARTDEARGNIPLDDKLNLIPAGQSHVYYGTRTSQGIQRQFSLEHQPTPKKILLDVLYSLPDQPNASATYEHWYTKKWDAELTLAQHAIDKLDYAVVKATPIL